MKLMFPFPSKSEDHIRNFDTSEKARLQYSFERSRAVLLYIRMWMDQYRFPTLSILILSINLGTHSNHFFGMAPRFSNTPSKADMFRTFSPSNRSARVKADSVPLYLRITRFLGLQGLRNFHASKN